jgi:hypothetical protein
MSSATPASCRICVPVLSIAKPMNRHMIITITMNSPSAATAQHTTRTAAHHIPTQHHLPSTTRVAAVNKSAAQASHRVRRAVSSSAMLPPSTAPSRLRSATAALFQR